MCKNCKIIEDVFESASSNAHYNLVPVYKMLEAMLQQKRISIYAGDCKFEDMLTELNKEQHFTVCFYLECVECYGMYFLGTCVRGVPKYKKVDNINQEKIDNILWGKEGTYFEERERKKW